jgi:hypothetical protein
MLSFMDFMAAEITKLRPFIAGGSLEVGSAQGQAAAPLARRAPARRRKCYGNHIGIFCLRS